jgi:N-acetylglucosamine-6-sulfatase
VHDLRKLDADTLTSWGIDSEFAEAYNTYKSIRIHSKDYSLFYSVWCNNQHELYDSLSDPGQMKNLYGTNTTATLLSRPIEQVSNRLDAALFVLKTCKGEACIKPWEELHPNLGVHTLAEALDVKYDGFYESYTKIHFERCEYGYIVESEGPVWEESKLTR